METEHEPVPAWRDPTTAPSAFVHGAVRDVVALVPGFVGFERLGGFAYFADQMAAALRAALEITWRRRTPVLPLTTYPAGALVSRQQSLADQLVQIDERYRPERIHLVGHSSGGVDAYFLTGSSTLAGVRWTAAQHATRAKIASIVTMGAPFLGTSLSDSEVASFLGGSSHTPPSLRELLGLAAGLTHLIRENDATLERLGAIAAGLPAAAGLIRQLTRHRELIGELSPKRMCERYEHFTPALFPRLTCFASYVAPPMRDNSSSLFRRLYGYTAQGSDKPAGTEQMAHTLALLEKTPRIGARTAERIVLTPASSDGVVNTLRQLPPHVQESQVGGLVIADHADLLGYYDRVDPATGRARNLSIFRSGAQFRDDQFFELFDRVADALI